jgi:hypothetical protein
MAELAPEAVFAGHAIEAIAGRGGMGVVYRARQLSLDRVVALKVIAPALTEDPAVRRRFLRESRVAASIDHPNVLPIYYAGEENGVAYIAMRHVPGDDLRALVRRLSRLDPHRAAGIVAQVAAALDAAHAAGLVHRDVKPANVLLGPADHAYLTDFGLTKNMLSEAGATRPGHWVGTLDFVAPEQIRGERVDARADVYGLGCLLYFALTGRPPFPRAGDEAKLWAHLSEPPPRVGDSEPGLAGFDAVIERALAKAPEDRFPSAGDLGRAGVAVAQRRDVTVGERMVATGAAAPVEAATRTAATRLHVPARPTAGQAGDERVPDRVVRRPRVRGFAAAALLLATGAAGAALLIGDREPPPAPTATRNGGETLTSIPLGGRLNSVAIAGGHVWTGGFEIRRLHAVAPDRARPIGSMRPEVGIGLTGMTAQDGSLWVITSRDRLLVRVDARTGDVKGSPITLPSAGNAVAAGRRSVWVATTTPELDPGDQILRIDQDTGATRRTFHAPDGIRRLTLAHGRLWLLASNPPRLIRMDPQTGRRRGQRLAGQNAGDLAAGAGALWATLTDVDQLIRLDPVSWNVTRIAVGRGPAGVAVHGGSVWVANGASSTLSRVSVRSRRVTEEVEVPWNPYELATAGDSVWVTSLAEGKLTRVSAPE